jgi:fucose permease
MNKSYAATQRACYMASATQAIIVNVSPVLFLTLQQAYAISFERLGRLVLINFITQILMDLMAHPLIVRFGYRVNMVAAHALAVAGLLAFALTPALLPGAPYAGFIAATILYSLGGGLLEVMTSPIVDALPSDAKAAAMSLLHSFYCWGQLAVILLTTALLWLLGPGSWPYIVAGWAALPLLNAFNFARVPMLMPPDEGKREKKRRRWLTNPLFFLALVTMVASGAAEQVMSQWASSFAEKSLGLPKLWGDLAGPCTFALMMALGRVAYGILGERIPLKPALLACGVLALTCYLTAAFSGAAAFSLAACALCGLAVSLMWPGTLSATSGRFPGAGSLLFALLAVAGDMGCALGPWISGVITDGVIARTPAGGLLSPEAAGLRAGMLSGAFFSLLLIAALAVSWVGDRRERRLRPGSSAGL